MLAILKAYTYNQVNCNWVALQQELDKLPVEYWRNPLRKGIADAIKYRRYKTGNARKAQITKEYNQVAVIMEKYATSRNDFIALVLSLIHI